MGLYIGPFRFTKRGMRVRVGPRAARLHLGAGGAGISTGAGPFTYYKRLGGKKHSTRSAPAGRPARAPRYTAANYPPQQPPAYGIPGQQPPAYGIPGQQPPAYGIPGLPPQQPPAYGIPDQPPRRPGRVFALIVIALLAIVPAIYALSWPLFLPGAAKLVELAWLALIGVGAWRYVSKRWPHWSALPRGLTTAAGILAGFLALSLVITAIVSSFSPGQASNNAPVAPAVAHSSSPAASSPAAPQPTTQPAATQQPTTQPAAQPTTQAALPPARCTPKTPSGNCYEPGEFCSSAEHGETGVAGDGEAIKCEPVSGGTTWHWEPV